MSRLGRPALAASLALGVVAVVAACSGNPASAGPATAVPAGVFAVEASDQGGYKFTPSALTVPSGSVTFSVKNAGTEVHEFEIFKGETVVDEIEGLVPGLTRDLTVTLDAGEYTYVCKLAAHDALGMKGALTVSPS